MDTTLKNKIILGTTYKQHQKAKIYGKICLKDLALLDIVLDLVNFCQLNLDLETKKCLEEKARTIINKSNIICKYKEKNFNDTKFIN